MPSPDVKPDQPKPGQQKFGAQYKLSDRSSVDFGYAHLFIRNAAINKSEPPLGGNLVGTYKNDVNILSVQYNQSF